MKTTKTKKIQLNQDDIYGDLWDFKMEYENYDGKINCRIVSAVTNLDADRYADVVFDLSKEDIEKLKDFVSEL